MANQTQQRIYGGGNISAATDNISGLRALAGTMTQIDVWIKEANTVDDITFHIKKNGVQIGSCDVLQNTTHGASSGYSETLADGDEITLDAAFVPTGGIVAPIEWRITVDDGESSGGGAGNVYSMDAKPSGTIASQCDYFDGTSLAGKWTEFQNSLFDAAIEDGLAKFTVPSSSGHLGGIIQALPSGDCTIIGKLRNINGNVTSSLIGLALLQDAGTSPNTADIILMSLERNASGLLYGAALNLWSDYATYSTYINSLSITEANDTPAFIYFRMRRTGTTWNFEFSYNGYKWTSLQGSYAESSFFTPVYFGIIVLNTTGADKQVEAELIYYKNADNQNLPGGLV